MVASLFLIASLTQAEPPNCGRFAVRRQIAAECCVEWTPIFQAMLPFQEKERALVVLSYLVSFG
jgi:hypothetical protein